MRYHERLVPCSIPWTPHKLGRAWEQGWKAAVCILSPLQETWQGHHFFWRGVCSQELCTEASEVVLLRIAFSYKMTIEYSILLPFFLHSFFPPFLPSPSPFLPPLSLLPPSSQTLHWWSNSSERAYANPPELCPQSQHQHYLHLQGNTNHSSIQSIVRVMSQLNSQ